jgi:hypothetical protein
VVLLKEMYDDIYYYLSNKDIEVEFDTHFSRSSKENFELFVNIYQDKVSVFEQKISKKDKSNNELFTIYNILPLEKEFYYPNKFYLWLF